MHGPQRVRSIGHKATVEDTDPATEWHRPPTHDIRRRGEREPRRWRRDGSHVQHPAVGHQRVSRTYRASAWPPAQALAQNGASLGPACAKARRPRPSVRSESSSRTVLAPGAPHGATVSGTVLPCAAGPTSPSNRSRPLLHAYWLGRAPRLRAGRTQTQVQPLIDGASPASTSSVTDCRRASAALPAYRGFNQVCRCVSSSRQVPGASVSPSRTPQAIAGLQFAVILTALCAVFNRPVSPPGDFDSTVHPGGRFG